MSKEKPIPDDLADFVEYDPVTGDLHWVANRSNVKAGAKIRSITRDGYFRFTLRGQQIVAHRAAWFLHYGTQPPTVIDHRNGIKTDNRIDNLRAATWVQNAANRRPRRTKATGRPKGVTLLPHGRYQAQIGAHGQHQYLGTFDTAEEAAAAYATAAVKLFGEYARIA